MSKQANLNSNAISQGLKNDAITQKADDDLVTWTGKRVRGFDQTGPSGTNDTGGVGKYLHAALAQQQVSKAGDDDEIIEYIDDQEPEPSEQARKKFKSRGGFGNFEGW